ncbi:hypothetical protein DBR33_02990 [Stenotrophomonas sp. HMWF022]|nr:hypothetical protein DBR20_20455 [Stenotrophomonas sp. HMWF023]PTT55932.1 hypothetical protein DBR33_02990 [Stenotrophomonas sp. HMWF022]
MPTLVGTDVGAPQALVSGGCARHPRPTTRRLSSGRPLRRRLAALWRRAEDASAVPPPSSESPRP